MTFGSDEDQSNLFHNLMPLNGPLKSIFTEYFRILFVHSDENCTTQSGKLRKIHKSIIEKIEN